jgi:hypothetical protein
VKGQVPGPDTTANIDALNVITILSFLAGVYDYFSENRISLDKSGSQETKLDLLRMEVDRGS